MKIIKKIGMALLSAILLLMPINVLGSSHYKDWIENGLTYPKNDQLIPAGPIELEWSSLNDAKSYKVYFDDKLIDTVNQNTTSYEVYTTKVSRHSYYIVALLNNNQEVKSELNEFYVSKKGLAYSRVNKAPYLNASWYYNWGTSSNISSSLEFVPMVWGSGSESSKLSAMKKAGYKTVLGYNEPEGTLSGQSNVSVNTAISRAPIFADSGLRVGSPAVEHASDVLKSGSWFNKFMSSIDHDDIDFIAVHEYFYNVCTCTNKGDAKKVAKEFLNNLQKIYDKYKKPIWITEMGVVNWDEYWKHYSYDSVNGRNEVLEFMGYIMNGVDGVKGLNDLTFIERYAWFPFDQTSVQAGASSLFVTQTDSKNNSSLKEGTLNDLGSLYKKTGNPSGYGSSVNIREATFTIKDVEYTGSALKPTVKVTYNGKTLKQNTNYTLTYSNNVEVGEGKVVVTGKGGYRSSKELYFNITPKKMSHLKIEPIEAMKYSGKEIKPSLIIKDGEDTLVINKDYTLQYSNNINASTKARIDIIGMGNYAGTLTTYFEIYKDIPVLPPVEDQPVIEQPVEKPEQNVNNDVPTNNEEVVTPENNETTSPENDGTTLLPDQEDTTQDQIQDDTSNSIENENNQENNDYIVYGIGILSVILLTVYYFVKHKKK